MTKILLAVIGSVALISACAAEQEGNQRSLLPSDADSKLFSATLPSPDEMAGGVAPLEYRVLISNHFDQVLTKPELHTVYFKARPYGDVECD